MENIDTREANPGYAADQIARALATAEGHPDPEIRERALNKAQKWTSVIKGMLSGALDIGSRLPNKKFPAWVTTEVVRGGFSTGKPVAGGAIQPHEQVWLAQSSGGRQELNEFFLTEEGLLQLDALLETGAYRFDTPEEGALLSVCWLLKHGHQEAATSILQAITPYFSALRFYPIPLTEARVERKGVVSLRTVGELRRRLEKVGVPEQIQKLHETVHHWNPLQDELVSLFMETVEGETPCLVEGRVQGGWPLQRVPNGWTERARALWAKYQTLRKRNKLCGRPDSKRSNLGRCLAVLKKCRKTTRSLSGREVGMLRAVLAGIVSARGLPESEQCHQLRSRQRRETSTPTHDRLARVLRDRLVTERADLGLERPQDFLDPIQGRQVPKNLRTKSNTADWEPPPN